MCKYFVTVFFWDVHWSKYILRYNVHILISCMTCYMFFGLEKPSQKMSLTILFPRVLDKSQLGDPMFSALRHSLSAQQNFWRQNYYGSRSTGAVLVNLYTSWIQASNQCYISCGLVNFSLAGGRTCLVGTVMCLIWSNSVHVEGKQTMDLISIPNINNITKLV